jgi:hypothetical protein
MPDLKDKLGRQIKLGSTVYFAVNKSNSGGIIRHGIVTRWIYEKGQYKVVIAGTGKPLSIARAVMRPIKELIVGLEPVRVEKRHPKCRRRLMDEKRPYFADACEGCELSGSHHFREPVCRMTGE